MLANTVVLTDNAATPADHSYDLVSRLGMDSIRREVGVASDLGSSLIVKNTIDLNATTAKNRHLIQLSKSEKDADGVLHPYSVHCVVTRDKGVSDSEILLALSQLAAFISSATNMNDVLVGGN